MALQWADFPSGEQGLYGSDTSLMLNGTPWLNLNNSVISDDPDPAIGSAGKCINHTSGSGGPVDALRMAVTDPDDVVGVAQNLFLGDFPTSVRPFLSFATTGNSIRYVLRVRPNGGLELARTGSETVVVTVDFPVLRANSWNLLETLVNLTTGEVEVRRNGTTVIDYTDPDPFIGEEVGIIGFPNRSIGQGVGPSNFFTKNLVVYNGQGSSFNDFQGNVLVTDLRPVSDQTLGDWTTSSGSAAWSLLDETPPNDSGYIQAGFAPLPAPAEVNLSNLPPDVTSVRGLISITRSLKTDGGDGNLQTSLTPNGTDYALGADNPVTTAATYRFDVSQLSPVTAAAWTPVEVDSLRQRYNRTV